ncbi:MAG: gamma-glutamyltransferase [Hyphomicrobiaceae bacterium]|nr:gamma-glutamyltransferase [Hyphomicrobiaceae bacterium]
MKHLKRLACALSLLTLTTAQPQTASAIDTRAEPEAASINQLSATKTATAQHHMIVAANPHASSVGRDILRLGGSAIDAAIAAQMVLNLVEPQSSGIGGGGFLLHWHAQQKHLTSFDGRETAPATAHPDRFMKDAQPMKFRAAVPGGLSVGTPGLLKMLEQAHKNQGRLPWGQLFQPAIYLARKGFAVSPRLNTLLKKADPKNFGPQARAYFFDAQQKPWPVGHILKNPAFAQSLENIARHGADFFHNGPLAAKIATTVQTSKRNKGDLTRADLASYRAIERPPLCIPYRGFRICGMGLPSSGMMTIAQILKLLERFDLGKSALNPKAIHLIAEASKLAYADRRRYMADPDFSPDARPLLDPHYLAKRSQLISPTQSMGKAKPGQPPFKKTSPGKDATIENNGTTHISIIDHWGNAASLTSSIEAAFGSRLMVGGFLLNNELTDFSFRPTDKQGRLIANRVEPGKRPRSSMSPTMIFDPKGQLVMITGSPGGSRIILYVLKTIIGHIDWKLNAAALVQMPNWGSRNGPLELEKNIGAEYIAQKMRAFGHKIRITPMTSGVHLILRQGNSLVGAADPRREGLPLGD